VTEATQTSLPVAVPRWGFGDVAITLLGALLVGNVLALLLLPATTPDHQTAGYAWAVLLVLVGPWVVLAGWPLLVTRLKGNGPVDDLALRTSWRAVGLGAGLGVVGLFTALAVAQVQIWVTRSDLDSRAADVAHLYVGGTPVALVLFALATAFGAPVVEELAFRGLTYGSFVKRGVGPTWSVVGTAALFALFHFEPARLLVLFVLGVFIGVVRARTGSTTASMVTHMVINLPGAVGILLVH
jgi:uncharacterized protein